MRVLLTGGNGFVGSHVLEELLRQGHEVTLLLRKSGDTRFIRDALTRTRVVHGDLLSVESLKPALSGAQAVIHCAGKTKAVHRRDYYVVNTVGTRNLVQACNGCGGELQRLVLVSSLAVSGPGTSRRPAREAAAPRPVTDYGRSKMLAEDCVRRHCRVGYTVLRPAAVYGPRDSDFLIVFRTVAGGLAPLIKGGRQRISMIYVADVVEAVLLALNRPDAGTGPYHLAHPMPVTQKELLEVIAGAMGKRPLYLPVPAFALYPAFMAREALSRLAGKASIMNLQKIPEYTAAGWVCSTARAAEELAFTARTPIEEGVRHALRWYVEDGWLREVA